MYRLFALEGDGSVKKCYGGEAGAYFTVEAALVLPVVLSVLLFVIYAMFFQYNRCVAEQDLGVLALRGAVSRTEDKELLAEEIEKYASEVDYGKYFMWKAGGIDLKLEGNQLRVSVQGELSYPLHVWKTMSVYENHRVNPTFFVRQCRKLIGGE